jgi:Pyruvate/2-oxoacid:ferredoxin oxidoreductase gamma subunit
MLLRQAGLGKRINMIMQTVFFKLSALLSSSFFAFTLDF